MALDTSLLNSISAAGIVNRSPFAQPGAIGGTSLLPDLLRGPALRALSRQSTADLVQISDFGQILNAAAALQDATSALTANSLGAAPAPAELFAETSAFVSAFNNLQFTLNSLGGSDLQGSLLVQDIGAQFQGIVAGNPDLASIGLTLQPDGTLTLDTMAFLNAINTNPAAVAQVFANNGQGLADQLGGLAQSITAPTTGAIPSAISFLMADVGNIQRTELTTIADILLPLQAQFVNLAELIASMEASDRTLAALLQG